MNYENKRKKENNFKKSDSDSELDSKACKIGSKKR